jgi:ABC-type ATPase with predicted acetyltransferase domain
MICVTTRRSKTREATVCACMKVSKSAVYCKARALPEIRFEDQPLTSFAGLVMFQPLFERLGLKRLHDVATVSRTLDGMDKTAVKELRRLSRSMVLERLK